jgi:ribonuclease HI
MIDEKLDARCNVIKKLAGSKIGGHPETLMSVYRASIRSVIEYDAAIYGNWYKRHDAAIQKKCNQVLKLINGLPRTTPANVLHAIACEAPIHIRREELLVKQVLREKAIQTSSYEIWQRTKNKIKEKDKKYLSPTHTCYINKHEMVNNIEQIKINNLKDTDLHIHTELHSIIGKKSDTNPTYMRSAGIEYINQSQGTKIYTDASLMNEECGIGIFSPSVGYEFSGKLANFSSICSAEMLAIYHALKYAHENSLHSPIVYTDSLSSCHALEKKTSDDYVYEMILEVLAKMKATNAKICWIPAHVGIEGNEKADELAKIALTMTDVPSIQNKIRNVDAAVMIKNQSRDMLQKEYDECEKGIKFKKIFPKILQKPWFNKNGMEANEIKLINRLISNFSYDKRWLFRFRKSDTENCDTCDTVETAEHLIFQCRKYLQTRRKFQKLLQVTSIEEMWKSDNRRDILKEIIRFANENSIIF